MAAGLIVTVVVDAVILYPVQTATNMLVYETGYFNAAEVRRFGLWMFGLTVAVLLGITIPYWRLLGFSLTAN
jgi:di/tricarboxylate transporter